MSSAAYIGFGSNQGDRENVFYEAVAELEKVADIVVKRSSRLYETAPIGIVDGGGTFLNGVIEVETELSPRELLEALRVIELRLGKTPTHKSDQSRIIDLDLLLFGSARTRTIRIRIGPNKPPRRSTTCRIISGAAINRPIMIKAKKARLVRKSFKNCISHLRIFV